MHEEPGQAGVAASLKCVYEVRHPELIRTKAAGSLARLYAVRHPENEPHRDPAEERMERATVIFTTRGSWTFRSADGTTELDPGRVLLVNAGETYACGHPTRFPSDRNLSLEVSSPPVEEGPTFARRWIPFSPSHARLLQQMCLEQASGEPGSRLQIDALASLLLVDALRRPGGDGSAGSRDQIEAARAFIHLNFRSDLRLTDIAGAAALSPFHMSREFKRHLKVTPRQYLIRVRLEHARRLLEATRLSVTEIAHDSGFPSLSHFINTFRAHTGVSPRRYRAGGRGLEAFRAVDSHQSNPLWRSYEGD